jgi:hypothetical protein
MPSIQLLSAGMTWIGSATRVLSLVMGRSRSIQRLLSPENKKAGVAEHPAFDHVGLLFNEPPGKAELLFI